MAVAHHHDRVDIWQIGCELDGLNNLTAEGAG
jgi:hypothetical protein